MKGLVQTAKRFQACEIFFPKERLDSCTSQTFHSMLQPECKNVKTHKLRFPKKWTPPVPRRRLSAVFTGIEKRTNMSKGSFITASSTHFSHFSHVPSIRITHRLILTIPEFLITVASPCTKKIDKFLPCFCPGTPNCKRPPNHRSTRKEYRSQCGETRESQAWPVGSWW